MNNFDVAKILTDYAEKANAAKTTEQLRSVVYALREELDLRKMRCEVRDNA